MRSDVTFSSLKISFSLTSSKFLTDVWETVMRATLDSILDTCEGTHIFLKTGKLVILHHHYYDTLMTPPEFFHSLETEQVTLWI